jgi:hypothetical protein
MNSILRTTNIKNQNLHVFAGFTELMLQDEAIQSHVEWTGVRIAPAAMTMHTQRHHHCTQPRPTFMYAAQHSLIVGTA